MEGINFTTGSAGVVPGEASNPATRLREERDAVQSGAQPPEPRVNEGPSTRTSISPEAQALARQERAQGSGETPQVSDDNRAPGTQAQQSAANANADDSGRLIDDASPNELLRG